VGRRKHNYKVKMEVKEYYGEGHGENNKIDLDTLHSEMFPFAITFAKKLGAKKVFVGEPRIKGKSRNKWLVPDILGIRDSTEKPYIIVECEKSHGNIFDNGGKIDTWSKDEELRKKADFHFILRGQAWYRRNKIDEFFGNDAKYYKFEDIKNEFKPEVL
jgi:hypothetical protein